MQAKHTEICALILVVLCVSIRKCNISICFIHHARVARWQHDKQDASSDRREFPLQKGSGKRNDFYTYTRAYARSTWCMFWAYGRLLLWMAAGQVTSTAAAAAL